MAGAQLDFFHLTDTSARSPRLAVVIPCYNHAAYVEAAIRSVLKQTRPVDRLIVIDDGSTDNSVEVIRAMGEPLVELHVQENQNAYNTINRGVAMAAADCDFIAILNSDDHYHPERFEKLLPVLLADTAAEVVCSGLRIIDKNGDSLAEDHPRSQWFRAIWSMEARDDLETAEWLGLGNFPATTSNILGRAAYMAAHPMRPYHYNHDYYFLTGAAVRGALSVYAEPLVNYRVHASNTMNTRPAPLMRELLRQQVDFLRETHVEMTGDPAMRRRYKLYMQAAFENISAFDSGLFLHVLGHALQAEDSAALDAYILGLDEEAMPELKRYPNRHHASNWPGGGPLGEASTLPEKLDAIREERNALKAEAADRRELARLLGQAAGDRRHAIGRLLGLAPRLDELPGKTAGEKLEALRALARSNPWLKALGK